MGKSYEAFDREEKASTDQLLPGRAEGPDGVCPAGGGGEHLEAGEGGRAGADREPLEEVEEAADVELEPSVGLGQVPRRLHHLGHKLNTIETSRVVPLTVRVPEQRVPKHMRVAPPNSDCGYSSGRDSTPSPQPLLQ